MAEKRGDMITFPSNGTRTPGYLSRPGAPGPHAAVVVLQEWWGLVAHCKDLADRFARAGFIALAPDLYHGEAAAEPDEARKLAMALDRDRAVAEIMAAIAYLQDLDDVRPGTVGVVGWCMGGALALSTAAQSDQVGAAVAFYGRPLSEADTMQITAPVLGLYGENDKGIPVAAVRAFAEKLAELDIPHQIHIYPGAGHAFFNETRPGAYDPAAAADAWQRTLDWFQEYLA